MALLKLKTASEAEIFNKYLNSRLINKNKNIILGITGSTGSGKSYIGLRLAELWYQEHFKEEFSTKNVCFSIEEIIMRLSSGELRRGDILILEEGGVLLGSLDFQSKISKLFTYVLQSFRSMNICLIITLPHLQMLNKTARMLLHCNFVTCGIDISKNISKVKPFFHQVNQSTGKIYPKYPLVKVNGKIEQLQRFNYSIPSEKLIFAYEIKKKKFVGDLIEGFKEDFKRRQTEEAIKMSRKELSKPESDAYEDEIEGLTIQQSADKRQRNYKTIWEARKRCKRKGYGIK